jgi:hypothetical protein
VVHRARDPQCIRAQESPATGCTHRPSSSRTRERQQPRLRGHVVATKYPLNSAFLDSVLLPRTYALCSPALPAQLTVASASTWRRCSKLLCSNWHRPTCARVRMGCRNYLTTAPQPAHEHPRSHPAGLHRSPTIQVTEILENSCPTQRMHAHHSQRKIFSNSWEIGYFTKVALVPTTLAPTPRVIF